MKVNLAINPTACCFVLLIIHCGISTAIEDYDQLLEEYKNYITSSQASGNDKTCTNLCDEPTTRKSEKRDAQCYCDKNCEMFGDCCLNYWKSCNSSFADAHVLYECLVPEFQLSNATSGEAPMAPDNYQVIVRCPKNYRDLATKIACEHPKDEDARTLPFVQGDDARTYRNHHCARCHGIVTWQRWRTELVCPEETNTTIKERLLLRQFTFTAQERQIIRETCHIEMLPINKTTTMTCDTLDECNDPTSAHYKPCFTYRMKLHTYMSDKLLRNPHCGLCSNIPTYMIARNKAIGSGPSENKPSLAILFDFSKAADIYGATKPKKVTITCKPGEIYDAVLKSCRAKRILSPSVRAPPGWTCPFHNETFPNTSKHVLVFANNSVFVPAHNRIYTPRWYVWHDGNITVCGNLSTSFVKMQKGDSTTLYSDVEYYITLVGFSLSIFALLIVLFTYSLFGELRTLPGKIIINLSVALLLSQVVFLYDIVADVSGNSCRAIAVVLHYLYIAAFCWMNAMAYDVSRTFAGKSHRSPTGSRKKVFLFCLLYAWGVPMVIVGIALAVNHTGTLDVGYGNEFYCWLTNPVALAVCFAAPVVLMLLFNIIALIRVLVAVRRVRKVTKKVRNQSTTGQDVGMCGKLTAVFGITWLLGLCAGYHIVLRIIYILFNSLQGVFIMIGFIMTRRILNLYLKKSGKQPLGTRTSSQTRSTMLSNTISDKKSNGSTPLVQRQPAANKQREKNAKANNMVVNGGDSPEAKLIATMEGPETRL